ncbi:unnamed protein product [Allacma fusca]|uniref:Exonuclease domain-containing protein n=1 Tax=Allacma fusca TaxID=39272 RepID=A0A8J2NUR2_9HEXA|nr:unnamed protein product [Allacma fusca]
MDLDTAKTMVLNFMAAGPENEKVAFIKSLFDTLYAHQLKVTENLVVKQKRRNAWELKSIPRKLAKGDGGSSVLKPTEKSAVLKPEDPPEAAGGEEEEVEVPWWKEFKDNSKIVAIDCEHVHYAKLKGIDRIKAASVSIVDFAGEVLFEARIRHNPDDCIINKHTIKVNGITKASVRMGISMEEAKLKVSNILQDKLVVHAAGSMDFRSLGLAIGDYYNFDLQSFWMEPSVNEAGVKVLTTISLKRMARKYFEKSFQEGAHSATADSKMTMRIFTDVYIPWKTGLGCSEIKEEDFSHFEDFGCK